MSNQPRKLSIRRMLRLASFERIEILVLAMLVLAFMVGGLTLAIVESQIRQAFVDTFSIDPASTMHPTAQLQRETLRFQIQVRGIASGAPMNRNELERQWGVTQSKVLVLADDGVNKVIQPQSRELIAQIKVDSQELRPLVQTLLNTPTGSQQVAAATALDEQLTNLERKVNDFARSEFSARTLSTVRIGSLVNAIRISLAVLAVILVLLTLSQIFVTRRAAQTRIHAALQELETARSIQQALLPQNIPPIPGLDVAWHFRAATETSGDFYDALLFSSDQVGFVIADVTGHGMAAALIASGARQTLRSELFHHQPNLAEAFAQTNRWLAVDMPERRFVAASCALIDSTSRRLTLANAGQMSPLLSRNGTLSYLEPPGMRFPLGITPQVCYQTLDLDLLVGDLLIFYTDGIVEAQNESGELFGFERLEETILKLNGSSAGVISETVFQAVWSFCGQTVPHDDITLVVIRALPLHSDQVGLQDTRNDESTNIVA